jgi:hypothetical protein
MKIILKISFAAAVLFSLASCEKWNETQAALAPESIEPGYGASPEYYANLRAYKATMLDRKLSWAWFGDWNGVGAYMSSSLGGMPDSLDIAAAWGDWMTMTPEKEADLEYVQKVKGTKVVVTSILTSFNWRGMAPDEYEEATEEEVMAYWGWEGDLNPRAIPTYAIEGISSPRMFLDEVTPAQEAAIRKYAQTEAQRIIDRGYDGFDLDYEIGYGPTGTLIEYYNRLVVYIDELSKYFGPKSGTDRLFVIDGAICYMPGVTGQCFDLFVIQAYASTSYTNLNTGSNRLSQAVNRLKPYIENINDIVEKVVMTEDYEQGRGATGGGTFTQEDGTRVNSLKGMALWQPTYNGKKYERHGGFGAYRVQFEYDAVGKIPGFYPWMREAIQAANPAAIQ